MVYLWPHVSNSDLYQKVHGPGQLLRHFKLPHDVNGALVLLQVGVQRAKLHVLLHHDV